MGTHTSDPCFYSVFVSPRSNFKMISGGFLLKGFYFRSGLIYVFVQKPFSSLKKSPLTPLQWLKMLRHTGFLVFYMLMWICGLTLAGPFKAAFISSHYDYTLAGIVSGFFVGTYFSHFWDVSNDEPILTVLSFSCQFSEIWTKASWSIFICSWIDGTLALWWGLNDWWTKQEKCWIRRT